MDTTQRGDRRIGLLVRLDNSFLGSRVSKTLQNISKGSQAGDHPAE